LIFLNYIIKMDKNKDQKYKKDTFDYESIDESDIYDQKNKHESFI